MHDHPIKQIADAVAAVSTIGVIAGWLPPVAALFTIVWTGMQITEKVTGKPFSELFKKAEAK